MIPSIIKSKASLLSFTFGANPPSSPTEVTNPFSFNTFFKLWNTSEPILTCNGKEMIYGKDYVYSNPEQNHSLTSGFIFLKQQLKSSLTIISNY